MHIFNSSVFKSVCIVIDAIDMGGGWLLTFYIESNQLIMK